MQALNLNSRYVCHSGGVRIFQHGYWSYTFVSTQSCKAWNSRITTMKLQIVLTSNNTSNNLVTVQKKEKNTIDKGWFCTPTIAQIGNNINIRQCMVDIERFMLQKSKCIKSILLKFDWMIQWINQVKGHPLWNLSCGKSEIQKEAYQLDYSLSRCQDYSLSRCPFLPNTKNRILPRFINHHHVKPIILASYCHGCKLLLSTFT